MANKGQEAKTSTLDAELMAAAVRGDLDFIQKYPNFSDLLAIDKDGRSVLLLAAREKPPGDIPAGANHAGIVDFIIREAMSQGHGQRLKECLEHRNGEGKNVLHVAAHIPNNGPILRSLVNAANRLSIKDYVNQKDSEFGSTALHFAARRIQAANMVALIDVGASLKVKSSPSADSGHTPKTAMELLAFSDPKHAGPCMLAFIKESKEGQRYLQQRYGQDVNTLDEKLLGSIVDIDLNANNFHPQAQLIALKTADTILRSSPPETAMPAFVRSLSYIDCHKAAAAATEEAKADAGLVKTLQTLNATTTRYQLKEKEADLFIRAKLLTDIAHPVAQQDAFAHATALISQCPDLALQELRRLNPELVFPAGGESKAAAAAPKAEKSAAERFFPLARRIAIAAVKTELAAVAQKLATADQKDLGMIAKYKYKRDLGQEQGKLNQFLTTLSDQVSTPTQLSQLVNTLPEGTHTQPLRGMLQDVLRERNMWAEPLVAAAAAAAAPGAAPG